MLIIVSIILSIMKLNKQGYFHYCTNLTVILQLFFVLLQVSTNAIHTIGSINQTNHGQNQQSTLSEQIIPCFPIKMAVINRNDSDNRLIMNHQKQKSDCSAAIMMTLNNKQNQAERFANIHSASIRITLTSQPQRNSTPTLIKSISKKWNRISNLLVKSTNSTNDRYHTRHMDPSILFARNDHNLLSSFYHKMQWLNNISPKHFGECYKIKFTMLHWYAIIIMPTNVWEMECYGLISVVSSILLLNNACLTMEIYLIIYAGYSKPMIQREGEREISINVVFSDWIFLQLELKFLWK